MTATCKTCGCEETSERQADGSYLRVFGCLCDGRTGGNMASLSQLSCAGSSDSAPFPDHVPIEPWDVDVTAGAARLLTSPSSLTPELEDCLTLLAQQIKLNNELMRELIQTQRELATAIREDGDSGDEDDEPRRYMDGTPI